MRLSKFLSLSVAMSRNQAKFFIRRGRLSVDGAVVTDPEFEVAEANRVVFDGKPIAVAGYQYIMLHKPPAYACMTSGSAHASVLELLKNRDTHRYYYFANVIGPESTGLVLLSDDARWAQRTKKRLMKKPRVYLARSRGSLRDDQIQQIREVLRSDGEAVSVVDVQRRDDQMLVLKSGQLGTQSILARCAAAGLEVDSLHLQELGRLRLGDLPEGGYLELAEGEIRV